MTHTYLITDRIGNTTSVRAPDREAAVRGRMDDQVAAVVRRRGMTPRAAEAWLLVGGFDPAAVTHASFCPCRGTSRTMAPAADLYGTGED